MGAQREKGSSGHERQMPGGQRKGRVETRSRIRECHPPANSHPQMAALPASASPAGQSALLTQGPECRRQGSSRRQGRQRGGQTRDAQNEDKDAHVQGNWLVFNPPARASTVLVTQRGGGGGELPPALPLGKGTQVAAEAGYTEGDPSHCRCPCPT